MLNLSSSLTFGLREIWSHKVRSFLSMLGVILGVAALVTMIAIVQGIISNFRLFFEEQGGIERVSIVDAQPPDWQAAIAAISPGRTLMDVDAIRQSVPLAVHVSPAINLRWQRHQSGQRDFWAPAFGVAYDYQYVWRFEAVEGRFITDLDVEQRSKVIVLGHMLRENLFPPEVDPIGQYVTLSDTLFRVVGVLKNYTIDQAGRNPLNWKNRRSFVPVTTGIFEFRDNDSIDQLDIRVASASQLDEVVPQLENTLLETRRRVLDFAIETREDEFQEFIILERSLMTALGGIGAISLLVGAIGIMNVMLASVHERIREIGVRKAVGARSSDIFYQFLTESVILSTLGGIIGLSLSYFLIVGVDMVLTDLAVRLSMPREALFLGLFFSMGVGIVAGIYPAFRAAKMNPIEALRFE